MSNLKQLLLTAKSATDNTNLQLVLEDFNTKVSNSLVELEGYSSYLSDQIMIDENYTPSVEESQKISLLITKAMCIYREALLFASKFNIEASIDQYINEEDHNGNQISILELTTDN